MSRRSMVVCGGLVVRPDSEVFAPQQLAGKMVALDYGNGTAYAGLQMLEGAMPREAEARWAWEWMASWGLLEGSFDPAAQLMHLG